MRRRMYCLLPDVAHTMQLIIDLREAGLSDRHIHVLARDDLPIDGIHKASLLQKTELAHGIRMGIGMGGVAGMLGGLLAVTIPPAGIALAGSSILLASTLAGAVFGALVSALVASGIPHHELRSFQARILLAGDILVILDVPANNVQMTGRMIERLHPEAIIGLAE